MLVARQHTLYKLKIEEDSAKADVAFIKFYHLGGNYDFAPAAEGTAVSPFPSQRQPLATHTSQATNPQNASLVANVNGTSVVIRNLASMTAEAIPQESAIAIRSDYVHNRFPIPTVPGRKADDVDSINFVLDVASWIGQPIWINEARNVMWRIATLYVNENAKIIQLRHHIRSMARHAAAENPCLIATTEEIRHFFAKLKDNNAFMRGEYVTEVRPEVRKQIFGKP